PADRSCRAWMEYFALSGTSRRGTPPVPKVSTSGAPDARAGAKNEGRPSEPPLLPIPLQCADFAPSVVARGLSGSARPHAIGGFAAKSAFDDLRHILGQPLPQHRAQQLCRRVLDATTGRFRTNVRRR